MMMTKDMMMKNGCKVTPDGKVVMKDGSTKMMMDGEIMDMKGKMMKGGQDKMMEGKMGK